jgi:hypothetical protein
MRRVIAATVATVLLAAGCAESEPASRAAGPAGPHAAPTTAGQPSVSPELAARLAAARVATAPYVTDLAAAERAGYTIITRMMPNMGYHYLNPKIEGFDVTKPAILVYVRNGGGWQLGALEWVFPEQPAAPPLPGATYGSFDAACHYTDGTFVPTAAEKDCPKTAPEGGAPFGFWHPKLTTLHVWLWYHNPDGLYHGTNPLVPAA